MVHHQFFFLKDKIDNIKHHLYNNGTELTHFQVQTSITSVKLQLGNDINGLITVYGPKLPDARQFRSQ